MPARPIALRLFATALEPRRIASLCGERIARCTLELGGKSAAVVLDDMDQAGRIVTGMPE
jgi:acyl-CoA reductase-like NAD-dependent aldehyde dehydrogenase